MYIGRAQSNLMGVLRLFLALSVLFGHIGVPLGISPIYAVQGFYIVSGFYMSLILNFMVAMNT